MRTWFPKLPPEPVAPMPSLPEWTEVSLLQNNPPLLPSTLLDLDFCPFRVLPPQHLHSYPFCSLRAPPSLGHSAWMHSLHHPSPPLIPKPTLSLQPQWPRQPVLWTREPLCSPSAQTLSSKQPTDDPSPSRVSGLQGHSAPRSPLTCLVPRFLLYAHVSWGLVPDLWSYSLCKCVLRDRCVLGCSQRGDYTCILCLDISPQHQTSMSP